ncbi:hypothetical protein ACSDQ9_01410 [Aestuariimicrobium soli]|uniref:hypothetical protein n=1 Tax=Aestuariimicrobium soli TaxID=2035834 RepID=UPI003EBCAA6C
MVTDFRIDAFALLRSNTPLQDAQSTLSGTTVPEPDPGMYGKLVGSSAQTTEPQTTQQHNDLIAALSELFGATSEGLEATGTCYQNVERDHIDLVMRSIGRRLF